MDALLAHVQAGIAAAKAEFPGIVSLSIDTWSVDYGLLRGDEEVRPVYAYRDSRTEVVIPKVQEILPFSELYAKPVAREPLNQSSAALSGSFAPTDRFENFEIHKVFLQFPNLNLETKSLADHSCDLIRGSLDYYS